MDKIALNNKEKLSEEGYISSLLNLINKNYRDAENYKRYAYPILKLDDPKDVENYEKVKAKYKNSCLYFQKFPFDNKSIRQTCKRLKQDSEIKKISNMKKNFYLCSFREVLH